LPHAAIEADEGYIYVRAEYPLAVKRLRKAIDDHTAWGSSGRTSSAPTTHSTYIMEGAGAFVCGEETALIASIEGKRGMPTPKPPFPSVSGLWGKPTIINNVETLSAGAACPQSGPGWLPEGRYERFSGAPRRSPYSQCCNSGLIEMPFGATLRESHLRVAGGHDVRYPGKAVSDGFKAVQIGGPSEDASRGPPRSPDRF